MIKIIAKFTNTYWDISMWIISNRYRSICRLSTSITRRSLGLNMSIHLSMISCGILFRSLAMASFKESRLAILRSRHNFAPGVLRSQNLLDSNLDNLVANDEAPLIEVVSCLSTFQGWACLCEFKLRLAWINTHYVLPACSFQESFSLIVHYNNISYLPLYSVQQLLI